MPGKVDSLFLISTFSIFMRARGQYSLWRHHNSVKLSTQRNINTLRINCTKLFIETYKGLPSHQRSAESHLNIAALVSLQHKAVKQVMWSSKGGCQGQKSNNESYGGMVSEGAGGDEKHFAWPNSPAPFRGPVRWLCVIYDDNCYTNFW